MDEIVTSEGSGEAACRGEPQEVNKEQHVSIQPDGVDSEVRTSIENISSIDKPENSADGDAMDDLEPQPEAKKEDAEESKEKSSENSVEITITHTDDDVEVTDEVITVDDTETDIEPWRLNRDAQFERAEAFFTQEKYDVALKNYLECIKDIPKDSGFTNLAQCIRRIAEVYHHQGEDEKAVQFLRAEKMYYESALISSKSIQQRLELLTSELEISDEVNAESLGKAAEYMYLGRLCREREQTPLALEYAGKATKLFQQYLGEDHETTQKCLTNFTELYAEVGKQEYQEKLKSFSKSDEPLDVHTANKTKEPATDEISSAQSTGDVSNDNLTGSLVAEVEEKTDWWIETIPIKVLVSIMFGFILCSLVLFGFAYCRTATWSAGCRSVRKQLSAYQHLIEYGWHKLEVLMYGRETDQ